MVSLTSNLVPWNQIQEPALSDIEELLTYEYSVTDSTEWIPGTIHLRVWPTNDHRLVFMWVLILENKAVRIFSSRDECVDACTLRGIEPSGSFQQISVARIGFDIRYYVYAAHENQTGSISLTREELLKFLGPIIQEVPSWDL